MARLTCFHLLEGLVAAWKRCSNPRSSSSLHLKALQDGKTTWLCCYYHIRSRLRESIEELKPPIHQNDTISQKKAKKTITFRIDPQILEKLAKASKEDKIVLNVLVNQIFENYVDWDRPAIKSGWVFLKKEVAKATINKLNEKEIQALATKLAREVMKDTLLAMKGRLDLDTWIGITRHRSIRSNFNYQQSSKDGNTRIIINHDMGLKWSIFHKWYYLKMLKDLGAKVAIDYTDKTIVLNIK